MTDPGPWMLAALLALGAGCSGDEDQAAEILAQSERVTFNTVAQLGPHRLESKRVTEHTDSGIHTTESVALDWADWDNFRVLQVRDGEVQREVRVLEGQPWVRAGERFERREDAELYRGVLAQTWNTWDLAVGAFSEQIGYDYDGQVVIEGRRARRFRLRLATDEELQIARDKDKATKTRRRTARFVPMAITGEVVLDEATSVRLTSEFEAQLVSRGGDRERMVRFREVRSGFGERPVIPDPRKKKGE